MKKTLHFTVITLFMLLLSYSASAQFQTISVQHVGHPIVIDGDFWEWDSATVHQIDTLDLGGTRLPPMGDSDFNPSFKIAWDNTSLYMYFNMVDDTIFSPDSISVDTWNRDGIEVAFNGNNRDFNMFWESAESDYDMKIMVTADATRDKIDFYSGYRSQYGTHNLAGFDLAISETENGWGAELLMPWTAISPFYTVVPDSIFLGLAANDSDTTGVRETIFRWSSDPVTSINTDGSGFGLLLFVTDSVPEPAPKPIVNIASHHNAEMKVWPNPTTGQLNISSNAIINSVSVANVLGQNMNITNAVQAKQINLNVNSLKEGLYIISIQREDGSVCTKKFYKQ